MLNAYSVVDVRADAFGVPFFQASNGLAIRMFSDAASDPQTTICKHPGDFKLVRIGTFDPLSGVLTPCEHESLGFASDYVRPVVPIGKVG